MDKKHAAPTRVDLAVVATICFGLFVVTSLSSVNQGLPTYNITDDELGATMLLEVAMAAFALGYLRLRGQPLGELFPSPTLRGTLTGAGLYAVIYVLFAAVHSLLALGIPALREAANPVQVDASAAMIIVMSLVNGLYEEVFLLGFLQRHLARVESHFAVGAVLLLRLSYHLYQGLPGTAFAIVFGGVLGYYYLRTGKLWPVVAAHVVADILALG